MADFTHLHLHTQFSLLDSALRLDDLFQAAADDKMEAVAMTDHGNMFGALDFYTKAKEHGIKPIIGCEVYVAPQSRLQRAGSNGGDDDEIAPYMTARSGMSHLILLAQNDVGYLNLCRIVSAGYLEGFYYRPRVDKEILAKYSEGLIATSACLKGEVTNLALIGDMDRAREAARWYQNAFGGRFYLELQNNGLPQQMMVNQRFQELGKDLGLKCVATADVHYLKREDAFSQEVLLAIQTGRQLDLDDHEVKSDQFYFKSQQTMKDEFRGNEEALATSMEIASQCNFEFKFTDTQGKKIYHFPNYEPPGGKGPVDYLNELSAAGLDRRLAEDEALGRPKLSADERKKYDARLERELRVINDMGFTGYFLIVQDFINHAKANDIPVGPGRGSGAGSLVAYVLRITDLDPIEHGLLFERFLNPERISLPDFDVDFCMDKRGAIIEYVVGKYGKDCVAQIITFGKLQARGVIRDVGRVFGIPIFDIDKLAKLVPETLNITLEEAFEQEVRLRQVTEKDPRLHRLFQICRQLEGLGRHASIHAAGLVISNRPMVEHCPLYKGKNDELVIQFDMNNADKIGLIKFDFLGLKTLTFLRTAEKLIRARHPEADFALHKIPLTDKKMYELLGRGDTAGVFQLESSGMTDLVKKVHPDAFGDLVAINALYRPGPLESGMVDDFIARKHGHTPVIYDFQELRPILAETYGVIVYQEQVQQIAMRLASYTAGGADLLRRAMGKKKHEEMEKQKATFIDGGVGNKFDKPKIEKIFDLMAKFAGYGFNKSHAAAYALITVHTAYIKARYLVEFFAALLSIERENTDKITKYIADARRHNIVILQPDINESDTDFTVLTEEKIRFGLGAIKGVGQIAIDTVLEARQKGGPFKDLFDLASRCNSRTVNKRVIEAFVKAGACDGFGVHRASLFKAIDGALEMGSSLQKKSDDNQNSFADLFGPEDGVFEKRNVSYPEEPRWHRLQELKHEKETTGFFMTGHPLDDFVKELSLYTTTTIGDCLAATSPKDVMIGAEVVGLREIITKKGDRMAFATLEDTTGQIDTVIFSDVFLENETILKAGDPVWVKAQLEVQEGVGKLLLSRKGNARVLPLRFAYEALGREMHLNFPLRKEGGAPIAAEKLTRLRDFVKGIAVPPADKGAGVVYLHLPVGPKSKTVLRLRETVPLRRDTVDLMQQILKEEEPQIEFR